ncbi:divergent PAP2 family protein [Scatolibacter rhodanostii]|uniref:divergent PAP2 family protein n=1 Tax=Scatolibacter rhodanostii TaxID=2014781 RepID=UPI000C081E6B|nr:divergent PAP2 family protein [Scatolibacter rhodanostii]
MNLSVIISNPLINVGVISWLLAQIIKNVIDYFKHKTFNKKRLAGAGGMPSSHAAVVCSVLLLSFYLYGFHSPIFGLAFVVALVVMYDATGVRWSAGLHAKAINHIVEYLENEDGIDKESLHKLIPTLNESLGHRMIEVVCGALLGFAISAFTYLVIM